VKRVSVTRCAVNADCSKLGRLGFSLPDMLKWNIDVAAVSSCSVPRFNAEPALGESCPHECREQAMMKDLLLSPADSCHGPPNLRRTIRRQQLREMVPLADSTIYEMEQRGEFPRRFALSPRCVVWDLAEVEAWLMARRAAPMRRAQHPDVTKRKTRPDKGQDQAPSRA
jgi:prophage regulatory protein